MKVRGCYRYRAPGRLAPRRGAVHASSVGGAASLDDDGRNRNVRLPIKVCVRVRGDGIEIDLTGSADQVETGISDLPICQVRRYAAQVTEFRWAADDPHQPAFG